MRHTICSSCGDYKALEGQRICASCFAELHANTIPPSPGGDITDLEYDVEWGEARKRMELGRVEYENAFNRADLKSDLLEEIHDLMNYAVFMAVRVRRLLPEFEGPLSKQLIRNNGHKV